MKTYLLTSSMYEGEIELRYDGNDLLIDYSNRAVLNKEQSTWFLSHIPRSITELKQLIADSKTAKITEVKLEVTFAMFWDRYDGKVRSSKVKTQKKWDRMPVSERIKAYNFIGKYKANIPYGVSAKYAESYLSAELWNN